jgi:hypothetical protein
MVRDVQLVAPSERSLVLKGGYALNEVLNALSHALGGAHRPIDHHHHVFAATPFSLTLRFPLC